MSDVSPWQRRQESFQSIPASKLKDWFVVPVTDGYVLPVYELCSSTDATVAILFGHANGFAAGSYLSLLEQFVPFAQVFAFDARGHGGAAPQQPVTPERFSPRCLALDLGIVARAVRQRTHLPLHFVGHSVNSSAALRLELEPDAPPWCSMTLFEPPVYPVASEQHGLEEAFERYRRLIAVTRKRRSQWRDREAFVSAVTGRGGFAGWHESQLKDHARATLRPQLDSKGYALCCAPEAEAALYESLIETGTWDRLRGVRRPVTLIGGDPGQPGPDWITLSMPRLARVLPNAKLKIIPGATHMMVFEALESCGDIVREQITETT